MNRRINKCTFLIVIIALVVGLAVPACVVTPTAVASGKTYELIWTGLLPDTHNVVVNGLKPWFKELEQKTNGMLKISYANPNTIAPEAQLYNAVQTGSVDAANLSLTLFPGKFVYYEPMALPFAYPSAEVGALTAKALYEKYPEYREMFADFKLLWIFGSGTGEISTRTGAVKTLEDLKGIRILNTNVTQGQIITSLGANNIRVPVADTYLSLERKMAEGILYPLPTLVSQRLQEIVKYTTLCHAQAGATAAVLSKKAFNKLPPDLQQLLEAESKTMGQRIGKVTDEGVTLARKTMEAGGTMFYELPDVERERWVKAVMPIHQEWLKDAQSKGIKNYKEIYDDTMRLAKEYYKKTSGQ